MIIQWTKWVIVGDQPKLCARVPRGAIRTNVSKDILVSQQSCTVNFSFSDPWSFISREEYFYSNTLSVPYSPPNFSVSALANTFSQSNLLGQSSLHQEWQTRARAGSHWVVKYFSQGWVTSRLGSQTNKFILNMRSVTVLINLCGRLLSLSLLMCYLVLHIYSVELLHPLPVPMSHDHEDDGDQETQHGHRD